MLTNKCSHIHTAKTGNKLVYPLKNPWNNQVCSTSPWPVYSFYALCSPEKQSCGLWLLALQDVSVMCE